MHAEPRPTGSADGSRVDPSRVRSMLMNDENGLEVRQLVVADDPQRIAEVMAPYVNAHEQRRETRAMDRATAEKLRRNGFRLVPVPVNELDALIVELGGAVLDMSAWHGQMYRWQDLHSIAVGSEGRTMAVDGRVRRCYGGHLRLMARSWVVQMEQGPRVQLDVVPQHLRSESQYHRLLGQTSTDAESLTSLAMHMLLQDGYAYVLTCACPQHDWHEHKHEDDEVESDEAVAETGRTSRGAMVMGPDVKPPMTVGQLMLSSHGSRANRGMLVFTPRIARELFPPGEPLAAGSRQTGRQP